MQIDRLDMFIFGAGGAAAVEPIEKIRLCDLPDEDHVNALAFKQDELIDRVNLLSNRVSADAKFSPEANSERDEYLEWLTGYQSELKVQYESYSGMSEYRSRLLEKIEMLNKIKHNYLSLKNKRKDQVGS